MRTDQNLARKSFRFSDSWKNDAAAGHAQAGIDDRLEGFEVREDGKVVVHSLSGNERNRLFLNRGGQDFQNASAISGLDSVADSRGWALLDYDHDGWLDVAVVNANAPLVNLFHNEISQIEGMSGRGVIALRFAGGGGSGFACRDGYGARVEVQLADGSRLKREHRCGEGFAAQNSATMIIGIGERSGAQSLTVHWPSGKQSTLEDVPAGSLVTVFENHPDGAFTREEYRRAGKPRPAPAASAGFPVHQPSPARVQIYTTTATWCAACLAHLPALGRLQQAGVELFGVPVDPDDDATKLGEYVEKRHPPYQMLTATSAAQRESVTAFFASELHLQNPVLPSSVITDGEGTVLEVMPGIPTLSQVRKWLAATR